MNCIERSHFSTEDNNGRGIPGISIEVYHLIKCKTPPESTSYIIRCENIHFVDLAKNLQKRIVALTEMYAKQFKVKMVSLCTIAEIRPKCYSCIYQSGCIYYQYVTI